MLSLSFLWLKIKFGHAVASCIMVCLLFVAGTTDTYAYYKGDLIDRTSMSHIRYAMNIEFGVFEELKDTSLDEMHCLAEALFFEASTESHTGRVAVAHVILSRMHDKTYEFRRLNTICSVIYQKRAFSYTHDGKSEHIDITDKFVYAKWRKCVFAAFTAVTGMDSNPVPGALYYFNPSIVSAKKKKWWYDNFDYAKTIGDHQFFTRKT